MRKQNWTKVGAVATILTLAVAVAALLMERGGASESSNNIGNSGSSCSATGGSECNQIVTEARAQSEERILAVSAAAATRDPQPPGPWPFVVVRDEGIGLKVRTNGMADGHAIGGIATHHQAWVVCQRDTGFDPDGNGESTWYQIAWPANAQPGDGYLESEVSSTGRGWAYASYLAPIATSRSVPNC